MVLICDVTRRDVRRKRSCNFNGTRGDKILRFESLVERKINRRRTEAESRFNGVVIDQKKVLLRVSNSCTGRWARKTCKINVIQLVIDRTRRY